MRWPYHFSDIFIEIYNKSFSCLLKINNFMHNATIQTGTMLLFSLFILGPIMRMNFVCVPDDFQYANFYVYRMLLFVYLQDPYCCMFTGC